MKQLALVTAISFSVGGHAQEAAVTVTATRVERPSLDIPNARL